MVRATSLLNSDFNTSSGTPIDHFEALTMGNQNWERVIEQTIKTTEFWLTNYHDIGWMIYWIVQVPVTNLIYNVTLNSSRQVGTLSNDLLFWLPIWQTLHTCSLERTSMCYLIHHSSWFFGITLNKVLCLGCSFFCCKFNFVYKIISKAAPMLDWPIIMILDGWYIG